ncbi:MAG: TraB/GumN family protein [Oceanicaulis sp.]
MKQILKSAAALAAGFLAGLSFAGPATAQAEYAAIEADPALWSISDSDSTVYLFGTVHFLPPELAWRSEAVDAALADAEIVYLETDALSPEAQAQMQRLIPQLGLNPPGTALTGLISDAALDDLAVVAGRLDLTPEALAAQIDPLKPWLASLMLAVRQIEAAGYDPQSGVEAKVTAAAQAAGKEFGYFETLEEQLRFFADLPLDVQIADFEVGLDQMVEEPELLSEMVQAWAVGDTRTLDAAFNGAMRDSSAELYDAIIVQRNRNWVPQIEAALASDRDVFVAVGAGHLPGEDGVIALLQAKGHAVTRR